jgi:hypothetical protein
VFKGFSCLSRWGSWDPEAQSEKWPAATLRVLRRSSEPVRNFPPQPRGPLLLQPLGMSPPAVPWGQAQLASGFHVKITVMLTGSRISQGRPPSWCSCWEHPAALPALLRCNSHTTRLTGLEYYQWLLAYSNSGVTIATSISKHFHPPPRKPAPINGHGPVSSLSVLGRQPPSALCLPQCATSGNFTYMEPSNMWPFVSGCFHLARCFPDSSMA